MTDETILYKLQRSLVKWLNTYPSMPSGYKIKFQEFTPNKSGIAMGSLQSAIVVVEDILGNYSAQYSFQLVHRIYPNSSNENLIGEEILDGIGEWVDNTEIYPEISDITITDIKRTSNSALIYKTDSGICDYNTTFIVEYINKK